MSYGFLLGAAINLRNEVSFRFRRPWPVQKRHSNWPSGSVHASSSAVRSFNTSFLCASWHALDVDTGDIGCHDLRFEAAWSLTRECGTLQSCVQLLQPSNDDVSEQLFVVHAAVVVTATDWTLGVGAQARCPKLKESKSNSAGTHWLSVGRSLTGKMKLFSLGLCVSLLVAFAAFFLSGLCVARLLWLPSDGPRGFWACRFSCLGVLFSSVFLCDV